MPASTFDYDVIIAGASLAGISCANELQSSGRRILLLDKQSFPRTKACGEGISIRAWKQLEQQGVDTHSLLHTNLRGFRILSDSEEFVLRPFPEESDYSLVGINRSLLDHALLESCLKKGKVEMQIGKKLIRYCSTPDECQVQLSDNQSFRCRFLLIASGANSRAPLGIRYSHLNLNRYATSRHYTFAHRPHSQSEVTIVLESDYEVYITPTTDTEVNIAVIGKKNQFKRFPDAVFQKNIHRLAENLFKQELMTHEAPLYTGPLGNRRRLSHQGRILFAGDACEQFDPIGGMGMTHALLSGALAGTALNRALESPQNFTSVLMDYERSRESIARPLRGFTRLTYFTLVSLKKFGAKRILLGSRLGSNVARAVHTDDEKTFLSGLIHLLGHPKGASWPVF